MDNTKPVFIFTMITKNRGIEKKTRVTVLIQKEVGHLHTIVRWWSGMVGSPSQEKQNLQNFVMRNNNVQRNKI